MKRGQADPPSLPEASSRPNTRRSPFAATPTMTSAAIETARPCSRTLRSVASSQRYEKAVSPSGRDWKAVTSAARTAQIRDPSLRLMPSIPRARTKSSTRRVLTPHHVRLLDHPEQGPLGPPPGVEQEGQVRAIAEPRDRQLDRPEPRVPASLAGSVAVGQAGVGVALGVGYPVSSVSSAPMTAWARIRTPSRRTSTSPSAIALCAVSSPAILSSAIVVSLRVVGSYSNDARMTRWPLSLTAPLLHQL